MNIHNVSDDQRGQSDPGDRQAIDLSPSIEPPIATGLPTRDPYLAVADPVAPRQRINPLAMIWRRRAIVLAVTAVCVLAALVKYWLTPAVYRSEARLYVQTSAAKPGADSQRPTSPFNNQANLNAQAELIKSTSVIAMVLAVDEIKRLKTFENSLYATFKQGIDAKVDKENEIITVSFDSPYPKEAKRVLEEVVKAYSGFHAKERRARFAELDKFRERARAELEQKQKELLDFKKANGAISLGGEKGNIVVQKLERLEQLLTDARVEKVNARSSLDSVKGMLNDPDKLRKLVEALRSSNPNGTTSVEEQSLRSQLFAMENQLGELRKRYLPEHPAIRAAEQTSATLRARIGEANRNVAEAHIMRLEQDLSRAENREKELQQSYEEQKRAALDLSGKMAQAEALDAEVKRLAGSMDKADQQLIQASAGESAGPTIQELDAPNTPTTPISPVRNVMLLQGLILGLLLGCAAALVRDWTDQGLRSEEDITLALATPILGSVPHMEGRPNPLAVGRKMDLEPASDAAETYRTIRTAVFFGTPDRESRTILVSSPQEGEGKSTFASNLAIAMAQTGKRVILVDADLRRPIQHRVFESKPGAGLSSVLTGGEPLDKAIQPSGVAGLDLLPSGPVPSNPAEILNSQPFTEALEELSVRYDHVVIDSPPVLMFADARILAAVCSVSILVLHATSSTRKGAAAAKLALEAVGGHLLGVVVNDVGGSARAGAEYEPLAINRRPAYGAERPGAARATGVTAQSFFDLRRK
jgi:capsular exopolysaccharide synthesis family protein